MGSGQPKSTTSVEELFQKESTSNHCGFYWQRGALIGEGAYGQVYECLNIETGELLATKFVELSGDPRSVVKEIQSLKLEITMLKGLRHKNIVRYITTDVASDYSGVDIIMEYVPGGSVRSLLNKFRRLHEKTVQQYIRQLLEGLAYLHSKEIIHRDVKCANLLLSNDGTIKLSDFGASRRLENIHGKKSLCKSLRGSPYWMAPEVVRRSGHSYSADIWSVGCVAIEMLTGSPPWANQAKEIKKVLGLVKKVKEPPVAPEFVSDLCRDFIQNCLIIDPDERATAEELLTHPFLNEAITINADEVSDVEYLDEDAYELEYDPDDVEPEDYEPAEDPEEVGTESIEGFSITNKELTVYHVDDFPITQDPPSLPEDERAAESNWARQQRLEEEHQRKLREDVKRAREQDWKAEIAKQSYQHFSYKY